MVQDSRVHGSLRSAAQGMLAAALLVCGCSGTKPSGSSEPVAAALPGIRGLVHGGQQPVTGASIQLYAVGTGGDGSAATPLLSPAAVTDSNGNFNITGTYTCPAGNPLAYIVATGGDPSPSTNNPNLALMAALGPCNNLSASTYIVINELTTVAAVYPLAPFISSPSAIGSGTSDAASLASAFTLASEMVNTATGTSPGTNVPAGVTIPVAQINTLGDILANCINSAGGTVGDSSSCGSLFSLTTPATVPATPPATNTILALLNLANNPTLNTAALYSMAAAVAPFQPAQTVTPPDLAVRLVQPSGFSVSPGSVSFGSWTEGFTSTAQTITITNGGATPVSLNSVNILGAGAGDFTFSSLMSIGCVSPIQPGISCTFAVIFAPSATGARSAYFAVGNGSANPVIYVPLSGTGAAPAVAGPVTASPSTLSFTEFGVPQNVKLTNFGNTPLTINGISISSAFAQTNSCIGMLQSQSICTIAVTALGSSSTSTLTGVLNVIDDAASGPQSVSLSYASNGVSAPLLLNFGGWSVGAKGSISTYVGLPQRGDGATLSISGPDAADFTLQSSSCYFSNLGQCTPLIYFSPSALGQRSAFLNISGAQGSGSIALTGIGQPPGIGFMIGYLTNGVLPISSYNFQAAFVGQSYSLQTEIYNTGTVPVTINAPMVTGANPSSFPVSQQCGTLQVGGSCSLVFYGAPVQYGYLSATVTVADSTGTVQQTLQLQDFGQADPPTATPSPLTFPDTQVGTQSGSLPVVMSAFNNDAITASVQGPFVLTQGSSCSHTPCTLYIAFAPAATGSLTGYLSFNDAIYNVVGSSVYLAGTGGVPAAGLSASSLTFGLRSVGTTSIAQPVMLTNIGNATLNLSSLSLTGANLGDYVLTNGCGSSISVGGSCNFTISFSPTATGTRTANVQIISNSATSPDLVTLTGTAQ
jgi:trimeric autotransporter adhesin